MSRGPVHAGDVLRAAAALGIGDAAGVRALAVAMELPGAGRRPLPPAAPGRPLPPGAPRPLPPAATDPPGPRPAPEPPAPPVALAAAAEPRGASLLSFPAAEPLPPRAGTALPAPGELLFAAPGTVPEVAPAPPWNPRTERAIMLAVAATEAAGREVDGRQLLDLVVRRLGGRPPTSRTRIPYRLRPTTRAGVHLLLDRGPSMRPFRHDHQWVARLARRVLPPDQLQVLDFRLAQGVSADGGRSWSGLQSWLPPGRPVLLVSDLGRLRPPVAGRHQATAADWLAFLHRLRRAGHPVTCLTPFRPESYPAALRRAVALVPLDRRTSVWSARSAVRGIRRAGPGG
jgi:hypothetical protein